VHEAHSDKQAESWPNRVFPLCEQSSTKGLAAALARRGVSGERVLCLVPHVAPPLFEPPVVPRSAALHRQLVKVVDWGLRSSLT
jgi:hypothetical protein